MRGRASDQVHHHHGAGERHPKEGTLTGGGGTGERSRQGEYRSMTSWARLPQGTHGAPGGIARARIAPLATGSRLMTDRFDT